MQNKQFAALVAAFCALSSISFAAPAALVRSFIGLNISNGYNIPDVMYATDFGIVSTESDECKEYFALSNVGDATLQLSAFYFNGANPGDFSTIADPSSLGPGNGATITVVFNPSTPGTKTAMLNIPSNDPINAVYSFGIKGEATAEADPAEVDIVPLDFDPVKFKCDSKGKCWITGKFKLWNSSTGATTNLEGGTMKIFGGNFGVVDPGQLLAFVDFTKVIKPGKGKRVKFKVEVPNPPGFDRVRVVVVPQAGVAEDQPGNNFINTGFAE